VSGVFQNVDPPPPHRPATVYTPAFGAGEGHNRWVERGWEVNSSEDARHCSVLCKYFVHDTIFVTSGEVKTGPREDRGGGHDPDKRPK
jgi:hypothetical protein